MVLDWLRGLGPLLVQMPRRPKRFVLILNDLLLLTLAIWLAFSIRLNEYYVPPSDGFRWLLAAAPVIGVVTFYCLGLYRLVTRFIGPGGTARLIGAAALATLLWVLVVQLSDVPGLLPRSTIILYFAFAASFIWCSRQIVGWLLRSIPEVKPAYFDGERKHIIIYGAGRSGAMLLDALRHSQEYRPMAFVDENRSVWGRVISGLKVHRPSRLAPLIAKYQAVEIFLAIPEKSRQRQRTILKRLQALPVAVKTLPGMADIAAGRISVTDLRTVGAEDLLGRDPVPADPALLSLSVRGKSVLVTGAGGSIGSQLCRNLMAQSPSALTLFDVSEPALYQIEREMQALAAPGQTVVTAVLGSVLDAGLVRRTIEHHKVKTIYHAAAYKHVPIVERNPAVGLENNTFGTMIVADAARDLGVERFVLVSTDKAVRPTNIMGASKRLAEHYLQSLAQSPEECNGTTFTMVRFGNVLDSSGSVVRVFREQIEKGGPVTVTDPNIIRYFMSIPEAAELVIQASGMAKGGDVFVLDMGNPVKIDDLARTMIRLMGRTVKDERNPRGEIAIVYTGLREGEKLYEELLIGDDATLTAHPRIRRSNEPFRPLAETNAEIEALRSAIASRDINAVHAVLRRSVEGYVPEMRSVLPPGTVAAERTLH